MAYFLCVGALKHDQRSMGWKTFSKRENGTVHPITSANDPYNSCRFAIKLPQTSYNIAVRKFRDRMSAQMSSSSSDRSSN
ncbi:unnamed protein product [Larinioides sclopetarius]|uniref:Uncharacterized protein n=1 Tax=Larinioides sclopetarius TaxID=280406 RepID=A0AAV1ZAZ1_9ARAC